MTLTAALVLVAVLVLAALAAHGLWSTRQARPRRAVAEAVPAKAERVEPSMDAPSVDANAAGVPLPTPARRSGARLDALIDAIATLALEAPASGEMLLAHLPTSRRAGSKPFYVEGLSAASGEWEGLALGQRYSELQAGVQLANRSGALNEIEYSEFVQKLQAFADAIAAVPDEYVDLATLAGDPGYVRDRIGVFKEIGVTYLNINVVGDDPLKVYEQVKAWAA